MYQISPNSLSDLTDSPPLTAGPSKRPKTPDSTKSVNNVDFEREFAFAEDPEARIEKEAAEAAFSAQTSSSFQSANPLFDQEVNSPPDREAQGYGKEEPSTVRNASVAIHDEPKQPFISTTTATTTTYETARDSAESLNINGTAPQKLSSEQESLPTGAESKPEAPANDTALVSVKKSSSFEEKHNALNEQYGALQKEMAKLSETTGNLQYMNDSINTENQVVGHDAKACRWMACL